MTTVGMVSPGAMGSAIGRGYAEAGLRVVATVAGRSARTRGLATGLELLPSLTDVVRAADVVLSVVPPGAAVATATAVRTAAEEAGTEVLVVDLNAVAPGTVGRVAAALGHLPLVDGSISGSPPERTRATMYLSGPRAGEVAALPHPRLDVQVLPGPPGAASAVKMGTSGVVKALAALFAHTLVTAEHWGVREVVQADLTGRFGDLLDAGWLARSAAKADRFVAEMHEVADTQQAAGLPRELFDGLAASWAHLAGTPAGRRTPEEADAVTDLAAVVASLRPPAG